MGRMGLLVRKRKLLVTFLALLLAFYSLVHVSSTDFSADPRESMKCARRQDREAIPYDREMPLIFIGGVPRSGTTLMRVMLDVHPLIRCGPETRVIPRLLKMRRDWMEKPEGEKLKLAGVSAPVLDAAVRAFILEIIARHDQAAPIVCNKDPFNLKHAVYLGKLFPNARFILLVRDGRAVVHSIISRKVTIKGFNLTSHRQYLQTWNSAMEVMYGQCATLGSRRCLPVYYEQLVLYPRAGMKRILEFLQVPWNDAVLHHQDFVGKAGGVFLSKMERSTDQVVRPINQQALAKWVGFFPRNVLMNMTDIAPMLQFFGYDALANPPNYSHFRPFQGRRL